MRKNILILEQDLLGVWSAFYHLEQVYGSSMGVEKLSEEANIG